MEPLVLVPLTIGLFSALHCIGMCGGIAGALTLSLPPAARGRRGALLGYVAAYNLGRVTTYAAGGAVVGLLGTSLFELISPRYGHTALRLLAAAMLVGIGLHLAGLFPRFARVEHLGAPLWRRLEPLGRRLLPVRSPARAFAFGVVWGWLPCGLVYSTLVWSAQADSALDGALYMAAFGLGTLPAVMAAGVFTGWFARLSRNRRLRLGVGLTLALVGLAGLWLHAPTPHGAI